MSYTEVVPILSKKCGLSRRRVNLTDSITISMVSIPLWATFTSLSDLRQAKKRNEAWNTDASANVAVDRKCRSRAQPALCWSKVSPQVRTRPQRHSHPPQQQHSENTQTESEIWGAVVFLRHATSVVKSSVRSDATDQGGVKASPAPGHILGPLRLFIFNK